MTLAQLSFSARLDALQTRIAAVAYQRDLCLAKLNAADDFGLTDLRNDLREQLADYRETLSDLVRQRDVLQASYWGD